MVSNLFRNRPFFHGFSSFCDVFMVKSIFHGPFSGHVIPAEHLLSVALDRGPAGKELDFTYQSRDSAELVRTYRKCH